MIIYAHRGAHENAPENSLAAFAHAIEQGADGVELDVRQCRSGEVVVSHDAHLGRVADRAAWVAELPYSILRQVDLGKGERIPLLDEVLQQVLDAGLRVNVELKSDVPRPRALAKAVRKLVARLRPEQQSRIVLSSFDPRLLWPLQGRIGSAEIAYLFDREHSGLIRSALLRPLIGCAWLHPHHPLCTPKRVMRWKNAGYRVCPFTVDSEVRAKELARVSIDGLITNRVPAIRGALAV